MTFGQGAHRVRLCRCFDTRTAGRHTLTTVTDGALRSALLRWIVSRASEGYSKHARVVRISYTLSRNTTVISKEASMRCIPTKLHGIFDYVGGVALIVAPMIFRFEHVGGPAVMIPRIIGVVLIAYSLLTQYEWGLLKVPPMLYHLVIDFAASLFLAISPWL